MTGQSQIIIFGKHLEIRFELIDSLIHVGYKKSLLLFFRQPVEDLRKRTLFPKPGNVDDLTLHFFGIDQQ